MEKYHFRPYEIHNVDKTGITTVQQTNPTVVERGVKQVWALRSGERVKLVTVAVGVSASGKMIPPCFVFPKAQFRSHFLASGPVGPVGSTSHSGWMQSEDFLMFMKPFCRYKKVSQNLPVLLYLDNRSSYLSVELIDYCQEKGAVFLTLPPHCLHKMQSFDRTVFGPLKKYVNSVWDRWIKNNGR